MSLAILSLKLFFLHNLFLVADGVLKTIIVLNVTLSNFYEGVLVLLEQTTSILNSRSIGAQEGLPRKLA